MEEKDIDPNMIGMVCYHHWIVWSNVEELVNKISKTGFEGIPRVAVCELPKGIKQKLSKYEQTKNLQYIILGDGLHRRSAALELRINLPCSIYSPKENVDTKKHGNNCGIMTGNWYKQHIQNFMDFLKPYIHKWGHPLRN